MSALVVTQIIDTQDHKIKHEIRHRTTGGLRSSLCNEDLWEMVMVITDYLDDILLLINLFAN